MSGHGPEEFNYSRKGSFFAKTIIGIILFILLWIWIYSKNGEGLPY